MAAEIRTNEYRKSHGREPRGRGTWAFAFGDPNAAPCFSRPDTTYADAKRWAQGEARRLGCSVAYTLP